MQRASLEVADGEFVAIVGPTGCGKSTLLNVTAGLFPPSPGRVEIFGAALAGLNRQSGYLFQSDALFPWKTALENVAIGLETAGVAAREARARAQEWLDARRPRRFRPALSAHAVRRAEEARRPRPGADPRSEDPADGRAVRPARRADPADHGQPAARSVERRPQGGAVRHPRSRGGDRAVRPRRHHVGGAGGAHHRRLAGAAGASARHRRGQARPAFHAAAPRDLADAEGRGAQGLRADRGRADALDRRRYTARGRIHSRPATNNLTERKRHASYCKSHCWRRRAGASARPVANAAGASVFMLTSSAFKDGGAGEARTPATTSTTRTASARTFRRRCPGRTRRRGPRASCC